MQHVIAHQPTAFATKALAFILATAAAVKMLATLWPVMLAITLLWWWMSR